MRQRRIFARLLALTVVVAFVAVACGSSSKSASKNTTTTAAATAVPTGGTLVLGLEQEPDCVDWAGICSGNSYGFWSANVTTIPRAFSVEKAGDSWEYKPTVLLDGEPTLTTSPKQVVTYKINPKAVWSDGQPITSHDFKYTWDQIAHGKDIYDRTGWSKIESVDDSKPDTAVVTYSSPYADWKSIFGSNYGVFPAHLLEGKDRDAEMANGYTWSGGPWKIESWQKTQQITLVPNDKYWGPKPKLDKVVFKFITDTSAEFQAFKAGEVLGIYPQPQLDAIDQIAAGITGAKAVYSADTGNAEGLWFNVSKPPFDDVNVRKAIAYSIDRDTIVNRLFGKLGVKKAMQTVTAPILKNFADQSAYAQYKPDLSQVDKIMTGGGWKKGADGIWAKGGQRASFVLKSTTGNKRRELTEQVIQQQLKAAGFEMSVTEAKAGDLFGDILPKGDFQIALFANVLTSFYPSNCNLFCSKNIPNAAANYSGNNWYRVNDPKIDAQFQPVESTLDESKAEAANKQGDAELAKNVYFLPLDPLPDILLTSTKIVGPVQDNPVMGPFWNLYAWGLKQ